MSKAVIRQSKRIYGLLIKFYPQSYRQEFRDEMKYVFSKSINDAYSERGEHGIFNLWTRTIVDAGKSLVTQHSENLKGSVSVK